MHDRDPRGLSRRDFVKLAIGVGVPSVGAIVYNIRLSSTAQTPEISPTPDPYAESDRANKELIQSMIVASESNILSEREKAESEFALESPRVLTFGQLNAFPWTIPFGVLADSDGKPYAAIFNHNMECMSDPMREAGYVGKTYVEPGPASSTFSLGVREIHLTENTPDARPQDVTVERFIDNYSVNINGTFHELPVLVLKGYTLNGEAVACPSLLESGEGVLGDILRGVEEKLENVDVEQIFETAGATLGNALGNLAQGTGRGIRDAFND